MAHQNKSKKREADTHNQQYKFRNIVIIIIIITVWTNNNNNNNNNNVPFLATKPCAGRKQPTKKREPSKRTGPSSLPTLAAIALTDHDPTHRRKEYRESRDDEQQQQQPATGCQHRCRNGFFLAVVVGIDPQDEDNSTYHNYRTGFPILLWIAQP